MGLMVKLARQRSETGSFIFAIISVAASSLGIAVFSGLIIYLCTLLNKQIDNQGLISYLTILGVIQGLILVYLFFSVLLLNGIKNQKPGQVMAYFVFGVLITLMSLAGSISWITLAPSMISKSFVVGTVWLFFSLMYMLILVMIYMAYKRIKSKERSRKPNKEVVTLKKKIIDGLGLPK